MAFGLTDAGFILKRLEDIKLEVEEGLRDSFGDINTGSDAVFGQVIGVFSRSLAEVWEQMENVYNAMYPSSAEGTPLDNSASLVGVSRLQPSASTAVVQMKGTEATVVPVDTEFSQSVNLKVYKTAIAETITKAKVHKIVVLVDVAADQTYTVTINGTDCNFVAVSRTKQEIAEGLKFAINLNVNVNEDVLAEYTTGDEFLTITILSITSSSFFSVLLNTNLSPDEIWTPVAVIADDLGNFPVPLGSIDTIDTPIAGLDDVTNLLDGITGRALESDAAFRIRRRVSLSVISAGTLNAIQSRLVQDLSDVTASFVFENRADYFSGNGIATIVYDADFVTGNSISFTMNYQSISSVNFVTSHNNTIELLRAAIEGLSTVESAVLTDTGGDNRTIQITCPAFNNRLYRITEPESEVTLGASQAIMSYILSNDGKPPHSFEAVVAALDTPTINQAVADKIWEIKPAGIETHGSKSVDVTDSNGDIQVIKFSHSVTKYVYVKLEYDRTDSDSEFPLDGETQILNEILRIGNTLSFGADLLIQVFEAAGYVAGGVTDVTVELAVKDDLGDPLVWQAVNIAIAVSELPAFDSTRVQPYISDVTP
jgi:uncharacterized phage protein gp47/JayE